MEFKDYYHILGVEPNTDEKAIKKAYHKLAKRYHPDVNPGDKAAEEKFKEVTEAYQAVSDPVKRRKYDELRQNYHQWEQRGGRGNFDWGRWQARPGEGSTRTMSQEEFAEIFGDLGGMGGFSDFFSSLFGMEHGNPRNTTRPGKRTQVGQDMEVEVSITLEEAYHGTSRVIQGPKKRIESKIPRGVYSGSKVRVAGQGGFGSGGGLRGDLYLLINVLPHPVYTVNKNDLSMELNVDFYTAVLGGEVKISTLSGELAIKIPSLSQTGKKFRLKGKGMPKLEKPQEYGDLYAILKIVLPDNMSEKEIETLKK